MAAGIVAASMARRCQNNLKKWRVFSLHPPRRLRGRVGRGLFRRRLRHVVGRRWRGIRRHRTRPSHRCRGLKLTERPRKSRPFRPDFRWPHAGETSPCPPCRRQGSDPREATKAAKAKAKAKAGNKNARQSGHPHSSHRTSNQAANGNGTAREATAANRAIGGIASMRRANASANARSACVSTSATSSTCAGAGSAASMHWNT